jgi:hypothetical protein
MEISPTGSRTLVLERLIEMITERGLSYYEHTDIHSDNYMAHMIDVIKDGNYLTSYDTNYLFCYSENDMVKKLDNLVNS